MLKKNLFVIKYTANRFTEIIMNIYLFFSFKYYFSTALPTPVASPTVSVAIPLGKYSLEKYTSTVLLCSSLEFYLYPEVETTQ